MLAPLPLHHTHPKVWDAGIKAKCRLVGGAIPIRGYLGVGYTEVEYEDTQPIPNHIHTEMGPVLMLGPEVSL